MKLQTQKMASVDASKPHSLVQGWVGRTNMAHGGPQGWLVPGELRKFLVKPSSP